MKTSNAMNGLCAKCEARLIYVGFEVVVVVTLKNAVLWFVTQCSLE
jgi:hypothetical protein